MASSIKKLVITAVKIATTPIEYTDRMTVMILPTADTAAISPNPTVVATAKQYHRLSLREVVP